MKAAWHERYGGPEVMMIGEYPRPEPGPHQLLIRVRATTVNRTDSGFRTPEYMIIRLMNGIFRPRRKILGTEFSGEVVALGHAVSEYSVGDAVFGLSPVRFGAHAEYLVVDEHAPIARVPQNVSMEEAAAVCDGLTLAMAYFDRIAPFQGKRILVHGASGSIGSAAVQLARICRMKVTAVCGPDGKALVSTLGADRVVDYTQSDFTRDRDRYHVVFDAVGKSTFFRCRKLLVPGGIYLSIEPGVLAHNMLLGLLSPVFFGARRVLFPLPAPKREDVEEVARLLELRQYRAVIDRVWPLDGIVEAMRYVDSRRKLGNVVLTVQ